MNRLSLATPVKRVLEFSAVIVCGIILVFTVRYGAGSYYYWSFINVEERASVAQHWEPLNRAALWEPTSEIFRRARAISALELLSLYASNPTILPDVDRHLVRDWEYLYTKIYGDRESFQNLQKAYDFTDTPAEQRLPDLKI